MESVVKSLDVGKLPLEERQKLAFDHSTPVDVLVKLAGDRNWIIRAGIAENHSTPISILVTLANDDIEVVREYVARNLSTPLNVLVKLAGDEDRDVCRSVASNPNTPSKVLHKLYRNLVRKDELDVEFAEVFVKKNILEQTEVLALIALYGQTVADTAAQSVVVAKNSLLEKVLTEYDYTAQRMSEEKSTGLVI